MGPRTGRVTRPWTGPAMAPRAGKPVRPCTGPCAPHRPREDPAQALRHLGRDKNFWGCPQNVLVRYVISEKGLYHSAFPAEDALVTPRLSPFSRCPRRPKPGPDRRRPVEDPGSPTKDGSDLGDRSADKPRSQLPFLRWQAPPEVGPHADQRPALPLHWLPEDLFRPNGQRHRSHPSARPVHGCVAGHAGHLRTAVIAQARAAAGTQQIHGLALANAGLLHHRQQLIRELLRDRGGG